MAIRASDSRNWYRPRPSAATSRTVHVVRRVHAASEIVESEHFVTPTPIPMTGQLTSTRPTTPTRLVNLDPVDADDRWTAAVVAAPASAASRSAR